MQVTTFPYSTMNMTVLEGPMEKTETESGNGNGKRKRKRKTETETETENGNGKRKRKIGNEMEALARGLV